MRFMSKLGKLLMFSRRHRSVRKTVLFLCTNLLLFAGFIFSLEIILIFCGVGDIVLPLPFLSGDFLKNLIF